MIPRRPLLMHRPFDQCLRLSSRGTCRQQGTPVDSVAQRKHRKGDNVQKLQLCCCARGVPLIGLITSKLGALVLLRLLTAHHKQAGCIGISMLAACPLQASRARSPCHACRLRSRICSTIKLATATTIITGGQSVSSSTHIYEQRAVAAACFPPRGDIRYVLLKPPPPPLPVRPTVSPQLPPRRGCVQLVERCA